MWSCRLIVRVMAVKLVVRGRLGVALVVVAVHGVAAVAADERTPSAAVGRLAVVLHVLGVGLRSERFLFGRADSPQVEGL